MTKIEFVVVMAGTLILDRVITRVQSYYHYWRFNRNLHRNWLKAQKRMTNCNHSRISTFNAGTDEFPLPTNQCLDCRAYQDSMGKWFPTP